MDYDFDYYGGKDLHLPIKPTKPVLDRNADSVEALAWAEALVDYEHELKSYEEDFAYYRAQKRLRMTALQDQLRDDYDITTGQFSILWQKAYDDGHSEGLRRVVEIFDELYDVASQFAAMEG